MVVTVFLKALNIWKQEENKTQDFKYSNASSMSETVIKKQTSFLVCSGIWYIKYSTLLINNEKGKHLKFIFRDNICQKILLKCHNVENMFLLFWFNWVQNY